MTKYLVHKGRKGRAEYRYNLFNKSTKLLIPILLPQTSMFLLEVLKFSRRKERGKRASAIRIIAHNYCDTSVSVNWPVLLRFHYSF